MMDRRAFLKGVTLLTVSGMLFKHGSTLAAFGPVLSRESPVYIDIRKMIVYRINGESPVHGYQSANMLWYNRWSATGRYIDQHFEIHQSLPNGIHTIHDARMIPDSFDVDFDDLLTRVMDDWRNQGLNDYPDWLELSGGKA